VKKGRFVGKSLAIGGQSEGEQEQHLDRSPSFYVASVENERTHIQSVLSLLLRRRERRRNDVDVKGERGECGYDDYDGLTLSPRPWTRAH